MPDVKQYSPGSFCWVELATTDQDGAREFYGKLFGWTANEFPMGEGQVYTMLQLRGKDVGALYRMQKEQEEQGVPPNWLCYVHVEDVDAAARKAESLGAAILAPPFDVFDVGRMSVLQDPTGAHLALWQPKSHIGAGITGETGAMCWHELQTHDTDAAKKFYTSLFGWGTKADETEYTEFVLGGDSFAGMMKIRPEWGEVPPHWGVYFMVDKCDETVAKAASLGGETCVPPMDIPNVGRFAALVDPQGAVFMVIQLTGPLT